MKRYFTLLLGVFFLLPIILHAQEDKNSAMRIFGVVGIGYPAFVLYGGGISFHRQVDKLQHFNMDVSFWGADDFNLNAVGMDIPFMVNTSIAYGLGFNKPRQYRVGFDLFGIGYSLVHSSRQVGNLESTLNKHGILIVLPSLHVTYHNGIYTGWKNTLTSFISYQRIGDSVFNTPLSGSELFEFKTYLMLGYEFDLERNHD